MALAKECVVVLDWHTHCVHVFSRSGTQLSSCISQGRRQDCLVDSPFFFCVDPAENILISDKNNHAIKILTKSGQHIHTIGKHGNKKGEIVLPLGISISRLGTIFVVSDNPNYALQCF